jgi:hypothetical protein
MGELSRLPLAAVSVAVMVAAGCGGGGDSPAVSGTGEKTVDWSMYPKGPTRQFIVPGGDNAVQTFGREASPAERRQATATISAWMRARAARDWAKDCSYFSSAYSEELAEDAHRVSEGKVKTCAEALAFFKQQASGNFVNTFGSGPVVSLRIGEGHGYAQYHGNDGRDWVVGVSKDDGEWKVAIAAPLDRLK